MDDRGCLTDGTERQAFPCDVNLQSRRPLNSTLDEGLGERVLYILLQSPAKRTRAVTAVRTRFLKYPLACFRRDDNLHLPVNQRVVQLAHQQIDDADQIFVSLVPWRSTHQLQDRLLFHELRHHETNQPLLRTKQTLRQSPGDFRLADAGRPEEEKAANGTQRRLETSAAAANGAGQSGDGL